MLGLLNGLSVSDITASAIDVFKGSWAIIILAIGIPLGFYIIKKIIGLVPKGK